MKRFALAILTFLASLQAVAATSYQGLWWNSPAGSQSGWGLNVVHQGTILFATWFTYDTDGKGLWLVMPELDFMPPNAYQSGYGYGSGPSGDTYTGNVYKTSGPVFGTTFDPTKVNATAVGVATLQFYTPTDGTFTATVNNYTETLTFNITKQVFSTMPTCEVGGTPGSSTNYSDLWWNQNESGWGVNVTQQGSTIFATWFTYDGTGRDAWYVMSNGVQTAGTQTWSGDVYQTVGSTYDKAWDGSKVVATKMGTGSFAFADSSHGTFTATVNGQTITKSVTRQLFSSPATVCR